MFTHRGLSGPAVLQLSSYWKAGEFMDIDLLPGKDAEKLLLQWKQDHPRALLRSHLSHQLPPKLVGELQNLFWQKIAERPLADWPDKDLQALSSKTMESTTPVLFFIGEVVDVTGHPGGFNFQWAWSSGYAAGISL